MERSSVLLTIPPKKRVSQKNFLSHFLVAIKKLGKIDDMIDAKRVLREIKIMKHL